MMLESLVFLARYSHDVACCDGDGQGILSWKERLLKLLNMVESTLIMVADTLS